MRPDRTGVPGQLSRRLCWLTLPCFFLLASLAFSQKAPDPGQIADLQRLQTARQTNERIAELALAEEARQQDYVIGSGDLLAIGILMYRNFRATCGSTSPGLWPFP